VNTNEGHIEKRWSNFGTNSLWNCPGSEKWPLSCSYSCNIAQFSVLPLVTVFQLVTDCCHPSWW